MFVMMKQVGKAINDAFHKTSADSGLRKEVEIKVCLAKRVGYKFAAVSHDINQYEYKPIRNIYI